MKSFKKLLAVLMSMLIIIGIVPYQVFAYAASDGKPTELNTEKGRVDVSPDWDTQFPYGTFAFEQSEAALEEGGDTLTVNVYRLGGTTGRATAIVRYSPALVPTGENSYGYSTAVSTDDIVIEVENALPIAKYQPVGKDPDPEEGGASVEKKENGEDVILSLNEKAAGYQWQSSAGEKWKDVSGASGAVFTAAKEDLEYFDFRCVYTQNGVEYCTDSLKGEKYKKTEEKPLPEMPDDIELNPEKSFTPLKPDEKDPYLSYDLYLTFADGEWVKSIRITAPDDNRSECIRQGLLMISDCEGGSLYDAANTLIFAVADNDKPEPFEIGFAETDISADKADGDAYITVRRTGGNQSMVSVVYESVDGSAKTGRDFEAVSGEVSFYGDAMEQKIQIPLIDDGKKDDEEKTLTIKLTQIKGDSDGIGRLSKTEAVIRLTNSGTGKGANLATILTDPDSIDLSGCVTDSSGSIVNVSPSAVIGSQKNKTEPLTASISGYGGDMQLQTHDYGKLIFNRSDYSQYDSDYWTTDYNVIAAGLNWNNAEKTGSGYKVSSDDSSSAVLNISNMPQMYDSFSGEYNFSAGWAEYMSFFDGDSYTYGWASVGNAYGSDYKYINCNPWVEEGGVFENDTLHWNNTGSLYSSWSITDNVSCLKIGTTQNGSYTSTNAQYAEITSGVLYRRSFDENLRMLIHTANDGDSDGLNVRTAPDGTAVLTSDSGVYASMKPTVSLVQNEGGITGGGDLYVGSKIKVSLNKTVSYNPYSGEELSAAVYLTRSDGSVVNASITRSNGTDDYIITLLWNGMTANDLNDTYTINVVMSRKQNLKIDLAPSVDHMVDEDGNILSSIDPSKIDKAYNLFWNSGEYYITFGYSGYTKNAPHFTTDLHFFDIYSYDNPFNVNGTVLEKSGMENLQWIRFNRDHEDCILFNGRMYAGDDIIILEPADLARADLTFRYYNKNYLSATSVMNTLIDSVALYWDGDTNGRIDGSYNKNTGYFEIDSDSDDELLMFLTPGTDYTETIFNYIENQNGDLGQMFLKVFYTMTPRAITPEPGSEGLRAQVLPALTTSITDPDSYAELTDQQKSYRYIYSGKDENGKYTSDSHAMYGAAATAVQYVDVPLGGDRSPVEPVTVGGKQKYIWNPEYRGNLIYDYSSPDPIFIEHSLAGNDIALAPSAELDNGGITMSSADRANLNGYLGSFTANSTIALCVQQQSVTTGELAGSDNTPEPESSSLIPNNTTPDSSYLSQMGSADPSADGGFDMADSGSDYPEFNLDLKTTIPKLKFGETTHDFISYSYDGLEHMISFALPMGTWKQGKGWSSPAKSIKDNADQFKYCMNIFFGPSGIAFSDDSYSDAVEKGKYTSKGFNAMIYFCGSFLFKYDPVENEFKFKQFAVGASGTFQYTYTHRFTACPLLYVCVKIGINVKITTGGKYDTKTVHGAELVGENAENKTMDLTKGRYYVFRTKYKTMDLKFKGKLALDLFEDEACTRKVEGSNGGFLKSDGKKPVTATMVMKDGFDLGGQTYYLRVSALENTKLSLLAPVVDQKSEIKWSGIKVDPELFLSVAGGIGVELMKLELTVKISAAVSMTFFPKEDTNFTFHYAKFNIGLAFKVVFLFYSQAMDLIGYTIKYDGEKDQWTHSWSALGDKYGGDFGTLSVMDSAGNIYDAHLTLPVDTSGTQNVYRQKDRADDFSLQAYKANDAAVPFELAGYSGSADAAKLADGLLAGYEYQAVTVGGENYVIYHIGRNNAVHANDNTMLVMSRLKMTGGQPGLVNPADESAQTPYILLDTLSDGKDDGTGDLSFCAEEQNGTVRAVWISYAGVTTQNEASTLQTLAAAAGNTVVKTASFTPGSDRFTPSVTVSGPADSNITLSDAADDAVVYITAEPYTDAQISSMTQTYSSYLAKIGYDINSSDRAVADIASYRTGTQRAVWTLNGKNSKINIAADNHPLQQIVLSDGITVENIESTKIGDTYYIVYTTSESFYTDASGSRTDDTDSIENMLTIKRLYLRTFTINEGAVQLGQGGKAILLRTLYDFDNNDSLSDGIYQDGMRSERRDDPYFGNLQFLYAKLGDRLSGEDEDFTLQSDSAENFLLFDMNGSTYLIREASLESIADAQHGSIIPFFSASAQNAEEEAQSYVSTGRNDTTIGVDGNGNLAAVYTAAVENTSDNALWLTKFDANTGSWGSGTILAMNHLGVYEDNIREGRSGKDAEDAYFGLLAGYDNGSLDAFTFAKPQIVLGQTADTLTVLTQGTMSYFRENPDNPDYPVIAIPDSDVTAGEFPRSESAPAGLGVYAVACGVGRQEIGNASISMPIFDFSAGAEPYAEISFMNTGDVGIRGSEAQPVNIALIAQGDSGESVLGEWTVTQNIISGQRVSLTGNLSIPSTLTDGTELVLSVSESDAYASQGGVPFSTVSEPVMTVYSRKELAVSDPVFKLINVDDNGSAIISVDLLAGNRGTENAEDVMLVFGYDSGFCKEDGSPVYAPLPLHANTLETSDVRLLSSSYIDEEKGIFRLGDISAGYGKHVTGTISVSADYFNDLATGGLSLAVELFSDGDTVSESENGLCTGVHDEYNGADNMHKVQIEHGTIFTAPYKITVPMGNTVRIPVSVNYTTGEDSPRILVSEFPGHGEDVHMGTMSLRGEQYSQGSGNGTLVLTPCSEGSGYVRVLDTNTNSFFDIAYSVTPTAEGINIFNDNDMFTFVNSDGTRYDASAAASTQSWLFDSIVPEWGADNTEPYLSNLSKGKVGSSFTFRTQAESIDLIFDGKVRVESTFNGFAPVEITASGGSGDNTDEYASVNFGSNPDNKSHTVTVTVTGTAGKTDYTAFDRLIEHFSEEGGVPVPDPDGSNPRIFFSRSFPDTASVKTGDTVSIRAFILDNSSLASVTLNGKTPKNLTKQDDSFWIVDFTVTDNTEFSLDAIDDSGNRTVESIQADWFDSDLTQSEGNAVPTVNAALMKRGSGTDADVQLTGGIPFSDEDSAYVRASAAASDGTDTAEITVSYMYFDENGDLILTDMTEFSDGVYTAVYNGWYIVRANDPEPDDGSWSQSVVHMTRVDTDKPYVLMMLSPDGKELKWNVTARNTGGAQSTVEYVSFNGMMIDIESGKTSADGSVPVNYNGYYMLTSHDAQYRYSTAYHYIKAFPVSLAEGKTQEDLFNIADEGDTFTLTIDPDMLTGGTYSQTESHVEIGEYAGEYEWIMLEADSGKELSEILNLSWDNDPLNGRYDSHPYVIYIRDKYEPFDEETVAQFTLQFADYSAVDAAIAAIPRAIYFTDDSYQALTAAKDAVVRKLTADKQASVDAMAQAISEANDNLVPVMHTVTVPGDCTVTQTYNKDSSKYYRLAIVNAPRTQDGKTFTYWARADGTPVSTYLKYAFYVTEDTSIHPVYGANRNDYLYIARLVDVRSNNDGTHSILVDHSVASTEGILGHGVMLTADADIGADENQMIISNDSLEKYQAEMSRAARTGLLEIPLEISGGTYYLRPYIIDAENNVYYGEIREVNIGTASGDSFGDVLLTGMLESSVVQSEEDIPSADEPETPSDSVWITIIKWLYTMVQKLMGYIRLMISKVMV